VIYGTGSYAGGGQFGLNRAGKEGVRGATLGLSRLVKIGAEISVLLFFGT
jgi:hypothetical protein